MDSYESDNAKFIKFRDIIISLNKDYLNKKSKSYGYDFLNDRPEFYIKDEISTNFLVSVNNEAVSMKNIKKSRFECFK